MIKTILTLLLTLVHLITPQDVHSAPTCNSIFESTRKAVQLKTVNKSNPGQAALLLTLNESEQAAVKNMLGTFRLTDSGEFNYAFLRPQPRKYKPGDKVIESLEAHIDGSPTSLRIEEKSVVTKKHAEDFFRDTQSKEVAKKMGLDSPLKWVPRDQKPQGTQYKTITVYGGKVGLKLRSGVYAIAKSRFREYYQVPTGGETIARLYEPSLGDVIFAEIKINAKKGDAPGAFLGVSGGVFKPRVAMNKRIATTIKKIDFTREDLNIRVALAGLKAEVIKLKNEKGDPLNKKDKVESYFEALELILKHDPYFFRPTIVVGYARDSYKATTSDGEYQFTVDKDIQTWIPDRNIEFGEMNKYIDRQSSFDFYGGRFIELKSPTNAKLSQSPIYNELYRLLQNNHIPMFRAGSGKYHHGRPKVENVDYISIHSSAARQGVYYWLINSFGNPFLNNPGGKISGSLDLLEVKIPIQAQSGKKYTAIFSYEVLTHFNGQKAAVLKGVHFIGSDNKTIKITDETDSLIQIAQNGSENKIYSINIESNLIMFPGRVGHYDLSRYEDFINRTSNQ